MRKRRRGGWEEKGGKGGGADDIGNTNTIESHLVKLLGVNIDSDLIVFPICQKLHRKLNSIYIYIPQRY